MIILKEPTSAKLIVFLATFVDIATYDNTPSQAPESCVFAHLSKVHFSWLPWNIRHWRCWRGVDHWQVCRPES